MKKFAAPRLLPDWLSGGLHAAAVAAASLVLVACWLGGEPPAAQAQDRAAAAPAMRTITLPTVTITARDVRPEPTTMAAAARTDCLPGSSGVNLQQ